MKNALFLLCTVLLPLLCSCTPIPMECLIDVRTAAEFREGSLSGAVNIPLDTVDSSFAQMIPEKDSRLYLYCRSGRRSAMAAGKLKKLGYTCVYDLGGMQEAGKKLGLPVIKPKDGVRNID